MLASNYPQGLETAVSTFPPSVQIATQHLDAGEQQASALAYEKQETLVIDERLGRLLLSSIRPSRVGQAHATSQI